MFAKSTLRKIDKILKILMSLKEFVIAVNKNTVFYY